MIFVCVASGPSLTRADVEYCLGKAQVVVVNDNYRLAPWADHLYAADYEWWLSTPGGFDEPNHKLSRTFAGKRWTCDASAAEEFDLCHVEHSTKPRAGCVWGSNGGIEAITLAQLLGATRIVLLGYDMGATGNTHWFGSHPTLERTHPLTKKRYVENLQRTKPENFPDWRREFVQLSGDIVNCTRATALTCFPRADIKDVL